jgi:His-Xaa-Ser system protein HxsD
MSTQTLDGFPKDLAVSDLAAGSVTLTVDAAVYPLEAVYGAAYIFIDRCFVLLDRPKAGSVAVTLAPKKGAAEAEVLRQMAGEFANELLTQAWRQKIVEENRVILETVTTQALAGALAHSTPAEPSLDDLASFDFTEEAFDDPLGIAMSWEEKYKKKTPTEAASEAPVEGGSAEAKP